MELENCLARPRPALPTRCFCKHTPLAPWDVLRGHPLAQDTRGSVALTLGTPQTFLPESTGDPEFLQRQACPFYTWQNFLSSEGPREGTVSL